MKPLRWLVPLVGVVMTILAVVVFFKFRLHLARLAEANAAFFVVLTPLPAVAAYRKKDPHIIALLGYILQLGALGILRNVMR